MKQVPDPEKMRSIQQLCDIREPFRLREKHEELFVKAMRENILWHSSRSEFYRNVLRTRTSFDLDRILSYDDCAEIPAIPAAFFKSHELLSVPRDGIVLHLTSSGTSGQKSQIFFDSWSLSAGQRMVDSVFESFGWVNPSTPVNYLLYTYETDPASSLGTAHTDNFLCKYAPQRASFYALRVNGKGSHEFDFFGCIERLREYAGSGLPVRIFGFPSFLYFTLQKMRDLNLPRLHLSPDSLVVLGGGWKGHADQAVPKTDLYGQVTDQLGIPLHRIRDSFGSVEHAVPYIECDHHHFHLPVWSHVIIRDVRTLAPLGFGQKGFLQFLTPYITSVPAQSVLMGDLASLHSGTECPCSIQSPYFVVHGRAGTSKNKSCAVAASELLGR